MLKWASPFSAKLKLTVFAILYYYTDLTVCLALIKRRASQSNLGQVCSQLYVQCRGQWRGVGRCLVKLQSPLWPAWFGWRARCRIRAAKQSNCAELIATTGRVAGFGEVAIENNVFFKLESVHFYYRCHTHTLYDTKIDVKYKFKRLRFIHKI